MAGSRHFLKNSTTNIVGCFCLAGKYPTQCWVEKFGGWGGGWGGGGRSGSRAGVGGGIWFKF